MYDKYQLAVLDAVRNSRDNLLVSAVAGAGKTTTLRAVAGALPADESLLVLTFGRDVSAEWRTILADMGLHGARAKTVHALCFEALQRHFPGIKLDANKGKTIYSIALRAWLRSDGYKQARAVHLQGCRGAKQRAFAAAQWTIETKRIWYKMSRAVSLAKLTCPASIADIEKLIEAHELTSIVLPVKNMAQAVAGCLREAAAATELTDWDDMLYLARKHRVPLEKYDNLIVDEAQDLSPIQHWVLEQACHKETRVFGAGDRRQAIFNFAGADSNSFDRLQTRFNCRVMPLSVSYRAPKSVIKLLTDTRLSDVIEAAPGAPDGAVERVPFARMLTLLGALPGDFIISRVNAPLVDLACHYARLGWKAVVVGRPVRDDCAELVTASAASTVTQFIFWLQHDARERAKLLMQQDRQNGDVYEDKRLVALQIAQEIRHRSQDLNEILHFADRLSAPHGPLPTDAIVLSTVHKLKGMERDRVWVLDWTFKRATQEDENLLYVAYTRARQSLFLVDKPADQKVARENKDGTIAIDSNWVLSDDAT